MKLNPIKLVSKVDSNKKYLHNQLVPKQSNLIGKTCYMGISFDIIYYLILEYFKYNENWSYDGSKYREIAFAFNYNLIKNMDKILESKYLKRNNFLSHYYNFNTLENINVLNGYENIVIGDIFKDFDIKNIKSLEHIDNIIEKIISFGSRIYYILPVYCFSGDNLYNSNSLTDNTINLALVSKYIFLDNYFTYLRNYKKIPIYRIITPNYVCYQDYDLFLYKQDIPKIVKSANKLPNNSFYLNKYPFLFSNQIAEALYKIHSNSLSRNYTINSSHNYCLYDLTKENPVYDITRQKIVEFKKDIMVEDINELEHKKMLKELFKRKKNDTINYSQDIIDNENKYSFKEFN